MFRAYQAAAGPMTNPFLKQYWDIVDHENHRHRVRAIKGATDCGPPRTYMHMNIKLKKLQADQERLSQIQKDNKFMLDRIADVMRGRGTFDNHNEYEPKSLNCWKRQSQMVQLAYDNQIILRRLMDTHPEYNHNKLEDEFLLQQRYRSNIMKYPPNWRELVKQEHEIRKKVRESIRKKYAKFYKQKPQKGAGRSSGGNARGRSKKKDTSSDDSSDEDSSPGGPRGNDSPPGDSSGRDSPSGDSSGNDSSTGDSRENDLPPRNSSGTDPPSNESSGDDSAPGAFNDGKARSCDSGQRDSSADDFSEEDLPSDSSGQEESSRNTSPKYLHSVSSLKHRKENYLSDSGDEILKEKTPSEEISGAKSPVTSDTEQVSRNFTSDVQVKESSRVSDQQNYREQSAANYSKEKVSTVSSAEQYLAEELDCQGDKTPHVMEQKKPLSDESFEGKDLSVLDEEIIRDETSGEYLNDINDREEKLRQKFQAKDCEKSLSSRSLRDVPSVGSFSDTYSPSPRSQTSQKKSSIESFSDRLAALSSEIRASKERFSFEYSRGGKYSLGSFESPGSVETISLKDFGKKDFSSREDTLTSLDRDYSSGFSAQSSSEKEGSPARSSVDTKELSPFFTRRSTQNGSSNDVQKVTSYGNGQSSRDKLFLDDVASSSSSHSLQEKHLNKYTIRQLNNASLKYTEQNSSSVGSSAATN